MGLFHRFPSSRHAATPAQQEVTGHRPKQHKRQSRAKAENQHRQRNGAKIFTLRRQNRCCAKCRSHTGAPYRPKEETYTELTTQTQFRKATETAIYPVTNGTTNNGDA